MCYFRQELWLNRLQGMNIYILLDIETLIRELLQWPPARFISFFIPLKLLFFFT